MDKAKASRFGSVMAVGALLGGALTSWLAPKMIAWYFDPPVDIGVNCRAATEWSMRNLQRAQLFGILVGAAISIALAVYLEKRNLAKPSDPR